MSFSPPAAFYDYPCSNHGHQRVERVDVTGGDGKKEAEQKRGALLHLGTWNSGEGQNYSSITSCREVTKVPLKLQETKTQKNVTQLRDY